MPAHTIRVLCDSKNTSAVVADANTKEPLFWWRGNDLRIELALSDFGAFLLAADIGTITVVVKNSGDGPSDSPLMIETIGAGDCDAGFVGSQWIAKTGELCVAEWTREEAALDAGTYHIIVSHDDGTGKRNTFLSSKIIVKEDGHDSISLSAPPTPPIEYYTKTEADAKFPLTSGGTQELPPEIQESLEAQWPEAVSVKIPPSSFTKALVVGQSNVNSGRPRGSIPYAAPRNDSVYIWDRHRERISIWDPEVISPTQHRDETADADPNPIRNIWARILPGKLADLTGRPFKVVSSTRSGIGLEAWVKDSNGGDNDAQGLYTRITDGATAANIKKFDFVFFDHGESSSSGISYPEALAEFYGQLVDDGLVDEKTIFIFREILSPSQNNPSIYKQFVTTHGNGYMVSNTGLVYSDGVHIDGDSHDVVATRALDWYKANKFESLVGDRETLQIPSTGFVHISGTSNKIPIAEFAGFLGGSQYPATPTVLAYGDNYSETSETLVPVVGSTYTRGGSGSDPFLDSYNLEFPATNSFLQSATTDIPAATDWVIGMRVKLLNSGSRNFLLSQYDGATGRWFIERNAAGNLRFFFDGNQILSTGTYTDLEGFVTLTVRRDSDNFYLKVDDETEQTLAVGSVSLRDLPTTIGAVIGQGQADAQLQKLVIYQRLLDTDELVSLRSWLSLI